MEVAAATEGEAMGKAATEEAATGAAATEHDPQEQQPKEEQPREQQQIACRTVIPRIPMTAFNRYALHFTSKKIYSLLVSNYLRSQHGCNAVL